MVGNNPKLERFADTHGLTAEKLINLLASAVKVTKMMNFASTTFS